MLLTLSDIELAQELLKKKEAEEAKKAKTSGLEPNPLDKNYEMLNCDLELVKPGSADYKVIEKYFEATSKHQWWQRAKKIINVWKMNRQEEVRAVRIVSNRLGKYVGQALQSAQNNCQSTFAVARHKSGSGGGDSQERSAHYAALGRSCRARHLLRQRVQQECCLW